MGHTCRGTINLATANIAVEDSCNFVISNGGAQTYHLKANSEVERQRWITALELAKAKAVHMQAESGKKNKHMPFFGAGFCVNNSLICWFCQTTPAMIVHRCLRPQARVEAAAPLRSSRRCAP